jgi:hypothetical protein
MCQRVAHDRRNAGRIVGQAVEGNNSGYSAHDDQSEANCDCTAATPARRVSSET